MVLAPEENELIHRIIKFVFDRKKGSFKSLNFPYDFSQLIANWKEDQHSLREDGIILLGLCKITQKHVEIIFKNAKETHDNLKIMESKFSTPIQDLYIEFPELEECVVSRQRIVQFVAEKNKITIADVTGTDSFNLGAHTAEIEDDLVTPPSDYLEDLNKLLMPLSVEIPRDSSPIGMGTFDTAPSSMATTTADFRGSPIADVEIFCQNSPFIIPTASQTPSGLHGSSESQADVAGPLTARSSQDEAGIWRDAELDVAGPLTATSSIEGTGVFDAEFSDEDDEQGPVYPDLELGDLPMLEEMIPQATSTPKKRDSEGEQNLVVPEKRQRLSTIVELVEDVPGAPRGPEAPEADAPRVQEELELPEATEADKTEAPPEADSGRRRSSRLKTKNRDPIEKKNVVQTRITKKKNQKDAKKAKPQSRLSKARSERQKSGTPISKRSGAGEAPQDAREAGSPILRNSEAVGAPENVNEPMGTDGPEDRFDPEARLDREMSPEALNLAYFEANDNIEAFGAAEDVRRNLTPIPVYSEVVGVPETTEDVVEQMDTGAHSPEHFDDFSSISAAFSTRCHVADDSGFNDSYNSRQDSRLEESRNEEGNPEKSTEQIKQEMMEMLKKSEQKSSAFSPMLSSICPSTSSKAAARGFMAILELAKSGKIDPPVQKEPYSEIQLTAKTSFEAGPSSSTNPVDSDD